MAPGSVPPTERHSAPGSAAAAVATTRALLYTRVSKDKTGIAQSPAEQQAELERVATALRWDVLDVVPDNDRSASRYAKKERPGWRKVLDRIEAGGVDVLMVWEPSRLTRSLRDGLDFLDLCERAGTKVNYNGRTWDVFDPYDRNIVLTDITRGEFEVEVARKRIMRNKTASLAAGKPAGRVLFGYRRVRDEHTGALLGQEVDEVAGVVVREVFTRVAHGESIRSIRLDLTRRGVAPQGGRLVAGDARPWAHNTLGHMLRNRSYLGHRTHGGKVAVENAWPPLIDAELFERVQAILDDPTRRKSQDVRVKRLLAGLLRCEVCQGTVTFKQQRCRSEIVHGPGEQWRGECRDCTWRGRRQGSPTAAYVLAGKHAPGRHTVDVVEVIAVPVATYICKEGGHVGATATRLEAGVRELLVTWLAEPDALDVWTTTEIDTVGLTAELKALEARLDGVADEVAGGDMSAKMAARIEAQLTPRIDELRATLSAARAEVPAPVAEMAGPDAAVKWDALSIEVQRFVIRATLRDCELRRSPNRAHRDDLGLRFRWAGQRLYEV